MAQLLDLCLAMAEFKLAVHVLTMTHSMHIMSWSSPCMLCCLSSRWGRWSHLNLSFHGFLSLNLLAPCVLGKLDCLLLGISQKDVVKDGPRLYLPDFEGNIADWTTFVQLLVINEVRIVNLRSLPLTLKATQADQWPSTIS